LHPRALRPRCWVALALAAAVTAGCAAGGAPGTGAPARGVVDVADLTNPYVGLEYSQWLVGPVAHLATTGEVERYLALRDDAAAAEFIAAFWARRDPAPELPGNPVRELFERRAEEADRRFSEAGYRGRRTDRGAIFIVYGEPQETRFDVAEFADDPPIEAWTYGPDSAPGLNGRPPAPEYRFAKYGDLTTFHRTLRLRRDPRTRLPGEPPAGASR
jgi:GWxTD domain-containing protein